MSKKGACYLFSRLLGIYVRRLSWEFIELELLVKQGLVSNALIVLASIISISLHPCSLGTQERRSSVYDYSTGRLIRNLGECVTSPPMVYTYFGERPEKVFANKYMNDYSHRMRVSEIINEYIMNNSL